MSRVPWPKFLHQQQQAHLVVGVVAQAEGPVGGDELYEIRNLLNRLVRLLEPSGDYAATVVRDSGRPEVYFAFVDEADAQKFSAALDAASTATYAGWASQRAFEIEGAKLAHLEASLPAPKPHSRRPSERDEAQLARRVRRGPRTTTKRYDDLE
jgi:hypothetical protein